MKISELIDFVADDIIKQRKSGKKISAKSQRDLEERMESQARAAYDSICVLRDGKWVRLHGDPQGTAENTKDKEENKNEK